MKKKNLVCFPFLVLVVLSVAACGKSDTASVSGDAVAVPPPVVGTPAPSPVGLPAPIPSQVQSQCYQYGGAYFAEQDLCRVQETVINGAGFWKFKNVVVNTNIVIFPNDLISVKTDGTPQIYVGDKNYGSGISVISSTHGYLSFVPSSYQSFKIRKVQITRCLGANGFGYACPQ